MQLNQKKFKTGKGYESHLTLTFKETVSSDVLASTWGDMLSGNEVATHALK